MSKNCSDCKYWEVSSLERPCVNCHGTVERPYFEPKEELKETVTIDQAKERLFKSLDDIQKIIDDAMEKGDRSVHISVVGDKVDVSVQPYKEEGWGEWKLVNGDYYCSKCNMMERYPQLHCPACGAKMKMPGVEGEK